MWYYREVKENKKQTTMTPWYCSRNLSMHMHVCTKISISKSNTSYNFVQRFF